MERAAARPGPEGYGGIIRRGAACQKIVCSTTDNVVVTNTPKGNQNQGVQTVSHNPLDSEVKDLDNSMTNGIRSALGVGGIVSLAFGLVILIWPSKTAAVLAAIIAIYMLIAGVVNLAIGIFSRKVGTWPRIGYLALGALCLIGAVYTFGNLSAAAAALGVIIGIVVGVAWIVEGVVGLTMMNDTPSKTWTIVLSIISILAGVLMVTSPLWGAALLGLFLGVSLVILGIIQIIRAFRYGQN